MSEWVGVIVTTAEKYLEGAADQTIRNRLILTLLKEYGRIEFNQNSHTLKWDVEYAQQPVEAYGDLGVLDFSRHDLYKQLEIDWRGYIATDMMSEKERLMNSGDVAIINRYGRIIPTLTKSMSNKFSGELFIDGYATGNENRLHGLESFMGAGTVAAGDRIAQPNDTYGGLSTALGAITGSWATDLGSGNFPNATVATDWPYGQGDSEYDYNSPKLVNYSSTAWGTGSTSWEDNCERVLRQTVLWLTHGGGKDSRPTCFLLATDLFYGFLNKLEAKQRIIIPHKEADDLGFPDVLNEQGVMVKSDYDVPTGTGYALNVYQMQLSSLYGKLFAPKGPEEDFRTHSFLFKIGFFGNARYNPKHFAKLAAYA